MARRISVSTTKAGVLQCDVFGELEKASTVILTVHDLGCNSLSWEAFVNHGCMAEMTKRATWVHVNLPGQEPNAEDLITGFQYPSMDDLAAALGEVCDNAGFHCPVIALGDGAGANIVARFALTGYKSLLGAVLIHCTSTTAGFLESMQDKNINLKLVGGMHPSAEQYLILHRFGDFNHAANAQEVSKTIDDFHKQLHSTLNAKNLRFYIDTFMHRSSLVERMGELKTPILIVTGQKANHNHTVHTFYNACLKSVSDRKLIEFIEIDNASNVVAGNPEKLAESMQYFMQGCGVLAGAPMPHVSVTSMAKGSTMEKLDKSDV